MLISWSRDAYGNTTWRIWGIKITLARIIVVIAIVAAGSVWSSLNPVNGGRIDPGCTKAYPVARGSYCYKS